ncbi:acyl-CoA dehydrogenase [Actinomadura sp. KC345]|uniref:acyl-CoA dehydrogenase family protein n=1 Tax=Actinomadura sp. KC345 TaxID=2530371 RepID=UPI0010442DA3|nr:acyl-CoA dehydrogenase family protein [Actinomadura sp. KC345]TDC44789.1 acyl-CoA dehydrogenase [Actinomadura sp. KC345]
MAEREFVLTPEMVALREAVRDHCARAWDEPAVRAVSEGQKSALDEWRVLGEQLGVLGLAVPERWGGAGAGLVEAAVVAEELGAVLAPVPYLSAVLAARSLLGSGDEAACADLLPGLCDGSRVFAVARADAAGRWAAAPTVRGVRDGGWFRLDGAAAGVVDGDAATDLLVVAEGPTLFHLAAEAPGLTRKLVPTLDLTRPQADLRFENVPARLVGGEGAAEPEPAEDAAVGLLAAELVGVSRTMFDMSVAYAKERMQFGRPIGSFQAVKHRCADMLVELELARSVAAHAAWAHDRAGRPDGDDPALAASLAQVVAADAAKRITGGAIQVLGGIAITWEHPAHLYYKRAVAAAALWGGRTHRTRLAALAVEGPAEGRTVHAR